MKSICCICNREKETSDGETIVLTESEKSSIQKLGQEAKDSYFYCRPCHRMLSNPESAAQLVKGVVQITLSQLKHPHAEGIGKRYYEFFLKNAVRK